VVVWSVSDRPVCGLVYNEETLHLFPLNYKVTLVLALILKSDSQFVLQVLMSKKSLREKVRERY